MPRLVPLLALTGQRIWRPLVGAALALLAVVALSVPPASARWGTSENLGGNRNALSGASLSGDGTATAVLAGTAEERLGAATHLGLRRAAATGVWSAPEDVGPQRVRSGTDDSYLWPQYARTLDESVDGARIIGAVRVINSGSHLMEVSAWTAEGSRRPTLAVQTDLQTDPQGWYPQEVTVAAGRGGAFVAVWLEHRYDPDGTGYARLRAATLDAAALGWSSPAILVDQRSTPITLPAVGIADSGLATALRADGSQVVGLERPAGGQWKLVCGCRQGAHASGTVSDVSLAVAPDGSAVAAWSYDAQDGSAADIETSVRPAGGGYWGGSYWGGSGPICCDAAHRSAHHPSLAMHPEHGTLLAWLVKERAAPAGAADHDEVIVSEFAGRDGATGWPAWGAPTSLGESQPAEYFEHILGRTLLGASPRPAVGWDRDGGALALWRAYAGGQEWRVVISERLAAGSWGSQELGGISGVPLRTMAYGAYRHPRLAMHPASRGGLAAWETPSGVMARMRADAPVAVIVSGPPARTRERRATFQLSSDQDDAELWCSLDNGQAQLCGRVYETPELDDGRHRLEVRARVGANEGDAAVREWSVDTTPPDTQILAILFGDRGTGTATFSASEEGASFRCRLEEGPWEPCSSPHTVPAEEDVPHRLYVAATDQAGNEDPTPALYSYKRAGGGRETCGVVCGVDSPPPAAVQCPRGSRLTVEAGPLVAVGLTAGACFRPVGGAVMASRGPVRINGLELALGSGEVRIDTARPSVSTTGAALLAFPGSELVVPLRAFGPIQVGRATDVKGSLFLPPEIYDWARSWNGLINDAVGGLRDYSDGWGSMRLRIEFSRNDGGSSILTTKVSLPNGLGPPLAKRRAGHPEQIQVDVRLVVSNARGVEVSPTIDVPELYLRGVLRLKDVHLRYEARQRYWFGSATALLPGGGGMRVTPEMRLSLGLSRYHRVLDVSGALQRLNRPIYGGLFLQRLGFKVNRGHEAWSGLGNPLVLALNAGLSAGPHLPRIGEALSLDGEGEIYVPAVPEEPTRYTVRGEGALAGVTVADAELNAFTTGMATFSGGLELTTSLGAARVRITDGWLDRDRDFSVEGEATATIGRLQGRLDALVSPLGTIVCARVGRLTPFLVYARRADGTPVRFGSPGCSVEPVRVVRPAASDGDVFTVPRGARGVTVAVDGAGAAPRVVLVGPGGVRLESALPGAPSAQSGHVAISDNDAATAFFAINRPRAGRWRVESLPGSTAVRGLRLGRSVAPPVVRARIRRDGSRRVLAWRATGLRGAQLRFVERGRAAARVVGASRASRGSLRFSPATRRGLAVIHAQVIRDGLPVTTLRVVSFRPPRPRRLTAPHSVKLRRVGAALALSWRRVPGASGYVVRIVGGASGDVVRSVGPNRTSLRVRGLGRRRGVTVSVAPVGPGGVPGPTAVTKTRSPSRKGG